MTKLWQKGDQVQNYGQGQGCTVHSADGESIVISCQSNVVAGKQSSLEEYGWHRIGNVQASVSDLPNEPPQRFSQTIN